MPRKRATKKTASAVKIVDFDLDDRTYQIDPARRKVYSRFVEIETSRASQILSIWRAGAASA